MSDTYEPPQPNAALVVGPNDFLVIGLPRGTTPEQMQLFRAEIGMHLDGNRFLIVAGAEEMAVFRNTSVPVDAGPGSGDPSAAPG